MENETDIQEHEDYDAIWGTIEETADVYGGESLEGAKAPEQAEVDIVPADGALPDEQSKPEPDSAPRYEPEQNSYDASEPYQSPYQGTTGDAVVKPPKDHYKLSTAYLIYEFDHNLKHFEYFSDGRCLCFEDDEDEPLVYIFLDQKSEHSPLAQAMMHAARVRLGIKESFKIDSRKKLDWYHAKRVNIENEIEAVKTAMNRHLSILKNDSRFLDGLEEQAKAFAESELGPKDKNLKMTHGTINFVTTKASAVIDKDEDAVFERNKHLKALFKDKGSREKYDMSVEVSVDYKQDSKLIAAEELANYQNWEVKAQEIEPNENGEIIVPEYEPLHPGWVIKPPARNCYFRGPRASKKENA